MLTEAAKTYLLAFVAVSPVDDDGITHIALGEGDKAQHPCLKNLAKVCTWLEPRWDTSELIRHWVGHTAPPPPARDTEEHTGPAPAPADYYGRW